MAAPKLITIGTQTLTAQEWVKTELNTGGVSANLMLMRIKRGWLPLDALSVPPITRQRGKRRLTPVLTTEEQAALLGFLRREAETPGCSRIIRVIHRKIVVAWQKGTI